MPLEKITSPQNPGIKRIARLRGKKGRDAKNLTIVEGLRELRQAMAAGLRMSAVYVCREGVYRCPEEFVQELEAAAVRVFDTSCTVYDKIAYGDRIEGVLALIEPPQIKLSDLKLKENPVVVVVERVEKPGNLGAILRTADAAGVDAVMVCDELCDIHNPNAIRASLGAIFAVPTLACTNQEALDFFRAKGIRTVAAVVQATEGLYAKDLSGPVAIILGSEDKGLSDFWVRNADIKLRIPMKGKVDSLNVSVSAAVLVYEAMRQRLACP